MKARSPGFYFSCVLPQREVVIEKSRATGLVEEVRWGGEQNVG